jgi:beta-phosphoglucomutase-like phosphatase (HAD superfamily)
VTEYARKHDALHVDLYAVSAQWRAAFWSEQDALRAAGHYLERRELRKREDELAAEREATARLLDAVAASQHISLVHRVQGPRPTRAMLDLPEDTVACVFELEGVLTGSAAVHAAAWEETFDEFLLRRSEHAGERFGGYAPFHTRRDYFAHIHGRPRLEGVRAFLASRGIRLPEGDPDDPPSAETVYGLANRKTEAFLRRLDAHGVRAYEGSRRYLEAAREAGLRCAVVSASAHTALILEQVGLARLIDERVDGNMIVAAGLRAWPAPDVLLAACRELDVEPHRTAVFETTDLGIAAGRAGGFELVVGIDRGRAAEALRGADLVVDDLSALLDVQLSG